MTARNWMQIAALASVLGVAGAAMAQNTDPTTRTGDSESTYAKEPPASGAIVTPEDKASGMGKHNDDAQDGNTGAGEDASPSNDNTTNDDALSVNPGPSSDDESSVNPGPSKDDESSVNPGPSNDEESSMNPGRANMEDASLR